MKINVTSVTHSVQAEAAFNAFKLKLSYQLVDGSLQGQIDCAAVLEQDGVGSRNIMSLRTSNGENFSGSQTLVKGDDTAGLTEAMQSTMSQIFLAPSEYSTKTEIENDEE